jgi:hypothetical protein
MGGGAIVTARAGSSNSAAGAGDSGVVRDRNHAEPAMAKAATTAAPAFILPSDMIIPPFQSAQGVHAEPLPSSNGVQQSRPVPSATHCALVVQVSRQTMPGSATPVFTHTFLPY